MFAVNRDRGTRKKKKRVISPEEERDRMIARGGAGSHDPRAIHGDPRGIPVLVKAAPVALMATPVATPVDVRHDEAQAGTSCHSRESSLAMAAVSDQDFDELLVPTELAAMLQVQVGSLPVGHPECPCGSGRCPCKCNMDAPIKEPPTRRTAATT